METNNDKKPESVAPAAAASDPDGLRGCLVFLVIPVIMLVDGVCLSSLWGWFMTPFHLPKIGVLHAIGLVILMRFFTIGTGSEKAVLKKKDVLTYANMKIVTMLIGFVIYRYMTK